MKKPIVISSLAMRFHKSDGWTEELLNQYLIKGKFVIKETFVDDFYWILEPYSVLDVERLYKDGHIGELLGKDRWGELKGKSDLEILRDRNW